MYILGIETSCDDTCIAVLKSKIKNQKSKSFEILSNVVSSQVKIHVKYGGVYPFLAKREHQRNLPLVLKQALLEARLLKSKSKEQKSKRQIKIQKLEKIDLIAVTIGPGLEPCLWQGVNFAKELAKKLKIPLVPVNHLEAHILVNFVGEKFQIPNSKSQINPKSKIQNPKTIFPAVCLVVSGGNTQLLLMKNIGRYKLLGQTRDDAAGECLDKVARILGLGYPGGPAIAAQSAQWKSNIQYPISNIQLPRPMIYQKNYDFSFSGLKTAFLYDFQSRSSKERKSINYRRAASFEVQQAVIDVLIYKTIKAVKDYKAKSIILGGGVAANDELRKQFKSLVKCLPRTVPLKAGLARGQMSNVNFFVPEKKFCADNAAMIAVTAFFEQKKATMDWQKIKANANLKI